MSQSAPSQAKTAVTSNSAEQLQQRVAFYGMDGDEQHYAAIASALNKVGPGTLDKFYALIATTPQLSRKFSTPQQMAQARQAQMDHWRTLFSGKLNAGYADRAHQIGLVHSRIGLEPRWYVGGYARVLSDVIQAVVEQSPLGRLPGMKALSRRLAALSRAALLDMELAISSYFDAESAARTKAVAMMGNALSGLAKGDLTVSLSDLPPEYAQLASDFNDTVQQLNGTMGAVAHGAEHIHGGAGEIRAASDDFAVRTERQAASLEQTAAAMNQITGIVQESASQTREINQSIDILRKDVSEGSSVVHSAVDAMDNIHKSSQEISQIVDVIEGIAFQTNLLALNAGVEAARAGDAGQGFAVVASEVRALAQRASDAAQGIKSLIGNSGAQVEKGVELVGRAGEVLTDMSGKIGDIGETMQGLTKYATSQAETLAEINVAVNDMDRMTQQNAAMIEQSNAASRSLAAEADTLSGLIEGFRFRTGGEVVRKSRSRAA